MFQSFREGIVPGSFQVQGLFVCECEREHLRYHMPLDMDMPSGVSLHPSAPTEELGEADDVTLL